MFVLRFRLFCTLSANDSLDFPICVLIFFCRLRILFHFEFLTDWKSGYDSVYYVYVVFFSFPVYLSGTGRRGRFKKCCIFHSVFFFIENRSTCVVLCHDEMVSKNHILTPFGLLFCFDLKKSMFQDEYVRNVVYSYY